MRILVVSDTHEDIETLRRVIERHDDINTIIHLGDGQDDIENIKKEYREKSIYNVWGNCDIGSNLPSMMELEVEGKKIFATHGHLFRVKKHLDELLAEAKRKEAKIVLYGHTHIPLIAVQDGVYIMNPGSLHKSMGCQGILNAEKVSSYGILGIENDDVSVKIFDI